ncbi:DUF1592 domain-containing protein [Phenylobacterium sp. LjRoot225]|uniref:DUF1592 domain-containing protein n=1 Tax=Phenylobacterium sp. LjRoot225 TaxID=3342285 RepID=UPI003ECECC9A
MRASRRHLRTATALAAAGLMAALVGCSTRREANAAGLVATAEAPGRVVGMRRLTEVQYRNAIADIFGAEIKIGGRFDPIVRPDHELIATGAADSTISPAGFEQFDVMARTIAAQVLDERRRATFLPCTPADPAKADAACARSFYRQLGVYLFRRPLTSAEVEFYATLAGRGGGPTQDFYKGLELGLASMLVSPEFLYRVETAAPDGAQLDPYSKAARLSFLIWNSVPDQALLEAAAHGDLETAKGLQAQVERMLASRRAEQGVRAFFTDFLMLDRVSDLSKDTVVYKRFTAAAAQDLKEQMLLTVVDHLISQDRPYPEIFTSRKTFLNRRLGLMYHAPVAKADGWEPYEIPTTDERAGLLGQGAFLALFSHEGRSSPTLRGRAVREVLLCQPVPNPPANVDFAGFNDTSNAVLKTARQRLTQHNTDPVCASCHKITDPLGLPLERFDGVGAFRNTENGAPINSSGSFEGKAFDGAAALGYLMSQSAGPTDCLTKRVAEYASGVTEDKMPKGWLDALGKGFQAGGYKYRALIEKVALSPEFYAVAEPPAPAAKVAALAAGPKTPNIQTGEVR